MRRRSWWQDVHRRTVLGGVFAEAVRDRQLFEQIRRLLDGEIHAICRAR